MTRPVARLGAQERERIYERRIRPDLLSGALASSAPFAIIVAGQPGAGVPVAAAKLRVELSRSAGKAVRLSEGWLRVYHPSWNDRSDANLPAPTALLRPDVKHWLHRALQDAQDQRLNLMLEDDLRDTRSIHRLAVRLREDGYLVQFVFVCTQPALSRLALMARYEIWRSHRLRSDVVTAQEHDSALANVRALAGQLEKKCAVDGLRVIDRQAKQIYDNRQADVRCLRAPRVQDRIDAELDRTLPPKELVNLAMCWETLVQRLVHDPQVPREVASQVLGWRNEAVARCDTNASTAQLLQWAREGAAFRVMDRFAFEKEFPHHARAVKSLGVAVIEAEKYDEAEGARLIASARENIAQRIECGDMARIAARARSAESGNSQTRPSA